MRLDFWNNPIVVSAFRVKYRKSAPTLSAALYVTALVVLGAVLYNNRDRLPGGLPWHRYYLTAVLGVTSAISALMALTLTQASLAAEVSNRTLDFQRIAALSPRAILTGKLFGEPVLAYLLLAASGPASVACMLMGSSTPLSLALVYFNLLTTTIFFGAVGLLQPLELPPGRASGSAGNSSAGLIVGFFSVVPMLFARGGSLTTNAVSRAIVGLFTPVVVVLAVAEGDAWRYNFNWYALEIPYLFLTPGVQLAATAVILTLMSRLLKNPVSPPLSKPQVYIGLTIWNLLVAGSLFDFLHAGGGGPVVVCAASFALFHLAAGGLAIYLSTPSKDALLSWIWRLRPARQGRLGWILAERSPNPAATCMIALFGPVQFLLFFMAPQTLGFSGPAAALPQIDWIDLACIGASTSLLLLNFGVWMQLGILLGTRVTAALLPVLAFVVQTVFCHLVGDYYKSELTLSFAASAHWRYWSQGNASHWLSGQPAAAPFWGLYGGLLLCGTTLLLRYLAGSRRIIRAKLQKMGLGRDQEKERASQAADAPATPETSSITAP